MNNFDRLFNFKRVVSGDKVYSMNAEGEKYEIEKCDYCGEERLKSDLVEYGLTLVCRDCLEELEEE